jgi:hypothetical protein
LRLTHPIDAAPSPGPHRDSVFKATKYSAPFARSPSYDTSVLMIPGVSYDPGTR